MQKWKDLSQTKKDEIIEYARINNIYPTCRYYKLEGIKIYPDTIKYHLNEEHREIVKTQCSQKYHECYKHDKKEVERKKKYNAKRTAEGITQKKWKEWYFSLTPEKKDELKNNINIHRLNNYDEYKRLAKQRYNDYKNSTTLEERRIKRAKTYTQEKKDIYNEKCKELYNTDPVYKLKCIIRNHINRGIKDNKNKKYTSKEFLGCTLDEFKLHIESKFKDNMSWDNHGRGKGKWHLDHIIPLSYIKDVGDEHAVKTVCHYSNYQPLWENKNLSKGVKIEYPFFCADEELIKEYNAIQNKKPAYNTTSHNNKNILHFQPHYYGTELKMLNNDKEMFTKLVTNRKKYLNKKNINTGDILRGMKISGIHYGYSHFPYQVIKQFIANYKPETIYDPCGGWGHRLLACGELPYIYNDKWTASASGVTDMINFHNIKNKIVYNYDCTIFTPKEQYDCIFTCPPYCNTEIYDDKKYDSEEQYIEFLYDMLTNAITKNVKVVGIMICKRYEKYISTFLNDGFNVETINLSKQKHHFTRTGTEINSEVLVIGTKKDLLKRRS